jgi:hypothetical protein
MREALVSRRGQMGQLLDCVTALETGEHGPASRFVVDAGDFYLEALMWANSAAESLFGESEGAAARTNGAPLQPGGQRTVRPPEQSQSTPPPVSTPPAVHPQAPPTDRDDSGEPTGRIARFVKKCLRLLGRRVDRGRR